MVQRSVTCSRMLSPIRQRYCVLAGFFAWVLAMSTSSTALADLKDDHGTGPSVSSNPSADELLTGDIQVVQLMNAHPRFAQGYEAFEVEPLALPDDVAVFLFFGTWCHDSQREVPRLLKLLEMAGLGEENIKLIGLDYRKREPGGRAAEFNVRYTPTAIFTRGGVEVGRIVERPNASLHEDIKAMFVEGG